MNFSSTSENQENPVKVEEITSGSQGQVEPVQSSPEASETNSTDTKSTENEPANSAENELAKSTENELDKPKSNEIEQKQTKLPQDKPTDQQNGQMEKVDIK